jgi:hypothetical protein
VASIRSPKVRRNNARINAALAVPIPELAAIRRAHWNDNGRIVAISIDARRGFNVLLVIWEIAAISFDGVSLSENAAGATEDCGRQRRGEHD